MNAPAENDSRDTAPTPDEHWRARLRRFLKPPRRLSFTTSGKYFVLLTLGIGFGAINTGNNLLFLLLGLMLSLIIASGILSEAVLRSLSASRNAPRRIYAGSAAPASFVLENPSRFPSLSIEVSERRATAETGPLAGQEIGPERVPWWKFWRFGGSKDTEHDTPLATAYTLRIEGDEHHRLPTRYELPARGRYILSGLNILTRFPFGLFEKRREFDQPDHLVVYPAPKSAEDWLTTVHARFGDIAQNSRGTGEEYFGLRDYRPGEDQRMIHWKSSARRGEVVVRETERQEQRAVDVCLVNCTGEPAQRRHLVEPDFEEGLGRVVGLIEELRRRGYRVGLQTLDTHLSASDQSNHLERMLSTLALVELRDGHHRLAAAQPASHTKGAKVGRILVGLSGATATAGADFDLILPFGSSGSDSSSRPASEDAA
ncbi:MAG: DUF58 domain-containing protein [Persicimonas sp.]